MPLSNSELKSRNEVLREVHERVDLDLACKITDALKDYATLRGSLKTNIVRSTLAYMLANAISQGSTDEDVCNLVEFYGEYIHSCAHGLLLAEQEMNDETPSETAH